MPRLAHLSDLHFGGHPPSQERIYAGLLATLRGLAVDALVFTGDVFDTNEPRAAWLEGFVRLHAAIESTLGGRKPTLILPGNHDRRASGVFAPWSEALFNALRTRFASRPDVQVFGADTPFLAQRGELPEFPVDVVAYDSTYLPGGIASAGGVIRQEDLLHAASQLGDSTRPLLFLLHHHLIPTPVTDTGAIDTHGRPALQRLMVDRVLPWLVSNGDREELTMTALGAGSALTTLQTLGRPVIVLHGHKHYATARLLKGLRADDADVLITSAGSCGVTQDFAGGDYEEAPRLWPSLNVLDVEGDDVTVTMHPWSPYQTDRKASARTLVRVRRDGLSWQPVERARDGADFDAVLLRNELEVSLAPSRAMVGRLDVVATRRLTPHPRAWLEKYWEVLEGEPGATVRELMVGGVRQRDVKCPARIAIPKDGVATWRIEGAVPAGLESRDASAYGSVELHCRSRAEVAELVVHLGPVKTTPFASATDLTTGRERPLPLRREGDTVIVSLERCPARTRLRVYWPLPR